jgi:hypothetical protein
VTGTTTLTATASDPNGVTAVKWYVDGVEVAYDGSGEAWSRPWDSTQVANGTHRVFVKARGAAGNWTTSAVTTLETANG